MLDDIHDDAYRNDDEIPQFEEYPDFYSGEYNNFDPIPEYHDYYEEFPTIYYENAKDEPPEEEERRREDRSSSSSGSSGASASTSAAMATGSAAVRSATRGRSGSRGRSSGGGSAGGSSSAFATASATSVLAATFIALVAVAAFVVPTIDNADLEVDLDVEFSGGSLYYSVYLSNPSSGTDYYVVVMEGQSEVYRELIDGTFMSDRITGLDGSKEHRVEIRTGLVPLYVTESTSIPGHPVWVEWNDPVTDYYSITYGLTLHSYSETTAVTLTDPETGSVLYTREISEGDASDTIADLKDGHAYDFKVYTASETYFSSTVSTQSPVVNADRLTITEDVLDYAISVSGSVPLTMNLYDKDTMAVLYSKVLTQGTNTGTVTYLQYEHDFLVEVASENTVYLSETASTGPADVPVQVNSLTGLSNTIVYDVTVRGSSRVITLDIYATEGDPAVFTKTLSEGSNTGTATGLLYGHEYIVELSDPGHTYVTEHVTTGKMDSDITVTGIGGLAYDSTDKALVTKTGNTEQTVQYSIDGGTSWSTTIPEFTDAGEYTVLFKAEETENYYALEEDSVAVSVAKADAVITAPTAATGLIYSGSAQALAAAGSNTTPGEFTYSETETGTYVADVPTAQNAGTYAVWYRFTPDDTDNYNTIDATLVSDTIVIAKADATYTAPTAVTNLVYTGESLALANPGSSVTAGEFTYSDAETGTYSMTIPSETNAGTYAVWYKFTPDDTDNYNSVDATLVSGAIVIAKANAAYTAPTAATSLTYSGSAQALATAGSNTTPGEFAYSDAEAGTYSTAIPTGTDAGTYAVWYKFTPTDTVNYNTVEATLVSDSIEIAKANAAYTAPTAKTGLLYDGTAQELIDAGSTADGTMKYCLTVDGTFSADIPTGTEAGTYNVYYMVEGDSNHNDLSPSDTYKVTVKIEEPTEITNVSLSYDSTLNAIEWSADKIVGEGAWSVYLIEGYAVQGSYVLPTGSNKSGTVGAADGFKLNHDNMAGYTVYVNLSGLTTRDAIIQDSKANTSITSDVIPAIATFEFNLIGTTMYITADVNLSDVGGYQLWYYYDSTDSTPYLQNDLTDLQPEGSVYKWDVDVGGSDAHTIKVEIRDGSDNLYGSADTYYVPAM